MISINSELARACVGVSVLSKFLAKLQLSEQDKKIIRSCAEGKSFCTITDTGTDTIAKLIGHNYRVHYIVTDTNPFLLLLW